MTTDGESAGVLHQAADMISALKAQLAKLTAEVEELRNPPQAIDETIAIVPVEALRVARAQFDYLADGFAKAGDVISQTICEIGACAIDKALGAGMPDGRRTSNWRDGAADEI